MFNICSCLRWLERYTTFSISVKDILAADQDHYFKGNIPFPSNILVKSSEESFKIMELRELFFQPIG